MTSTLGIKKIQYPNGTNSITIDSSGSAAITTANITTANITNATATGTITTPSINGGQIGGRRNIVINGAMNVAQRSTSVTGVGSSSGYFTLDRYYISASGTAGRATMSQVADVHDGFANALKLDCTTADTSIAAGEFFVLAHRLEGQDLQQLKKGTSEAEAVTVSFYVKGNANATYALELYDAVGGRHASQLFNVTTSWNRISLTFNGDTTDSLADSNALALEINIWLHAGSNLTSGTINGDFASADNTRRAAGISSFFDSTDRTFFITGLQLEIGSQATAFEHRSFGEELKLCQRYYQQIVGVSDQTCLGYGRANGSSIAEVAVPLAVSLRASPTLNALAFVNFGTAGFGGATATPTVRKFTPEGAVLHLAFTASGLTNNRVATVFTSSSSTLSMSSEL